MRKWRPMVFLIFCGIAASLLPAASRASAPSSNQLARSFQVTYEVQLHSLSPEGQELRVWIPLATSDRYQKIRKRLIQAPAPYRVTRDLDYGNDILFLTLRKPIPPTLHLSVEYEAQVHGEQLPIKKRVVLAPAMTPSEMKLHLQSNQLMVVNEEVRKLAQEVTRQAKTPAEKAEAIYHYVIDRMRYDKETPGWGRGDTLRACTVGAGNCTDFHSLFISLARASGIPARFQIGLPIPEKLEGEIPGYHCWAEFYLPGTGWVPVDASEAWKHKERLNYFFGTYDPNRLAFSRGRDVQLVPQPASGPINIFFFPYAELDGKSVEKDKIDTKFRFRDLANT